ncbi:MAG TPA: hypothetical protein VED84_08975, partial [Acidimicrobiales bacterium]|nr:hypothetical protein [Acidimicrobiales bacterium]
TCIAYVYPTGAGSSCGGPGVDWIGDNAVVVFGMTQTNVKTVLVEYSRRILHLATIAAPHGFLRDLRFFVGRAPADAGTPQQILMLSARGVTIGSQTFE